MRLGTVTETDLPCPKCGSSLSEHRWQNTATDSRATLFCGRCEDEQEHLYKLTADDLPFCGCGDPEAAYNLIRDVLELTAARWEENASDARRSDLRKQVRELIGGGDGTYYLVLYVIDHAGLTEHGGSVGGAWLTAKGKHYLELMRRHEYDDFDQQVGYPHEGQDCTQDCRHWQASHEEWEKQRLTEGR